MLLMYLLIVVVPVFLLGFWAERSMFDLLRTDYATSVEEAVEQVIENIAFRKQTFELLATRSAMDGELAARLSATYGDAFSQWETINYVDRAFGTVGSSLPDIGFFRIYHRNPTLTEDGGLVWKPAGRMLTDVDEETWFAETAASPKSMGWHVYMDPDDGRMHLALTHRISWITGSEPVGAIILGIEARDVFDPLLKKSFSGKGDVYLLDDRGVVFSGTSAEYTGQAAAETPLKAMAAVDGMVTDTVDGRRSVVLTREISSGWHILTIMPLSGLEAGTKAMSMRMIGITLMLTLLSALLVLAVLNNLVRRIRGLETKMATVTTGQFDVAVPEGYKDELGDLETRFNLMAVRLGAQTEEIAEAQAREREEALKALEAQINPHFLYNTLGIIRWRALDSGDEPLCRLVDDMTVFYRLALNKGNAVLTVKRELEHARAYIAIQQHRYMNSVQVEWRVEEAVEELFTIHLLLQPVIENSYHHGMVAKRGHGKLLVAAERTEDGVRFTVRDNGIGMTEDALAALRRAVNPEDARLAAARVEEARIEAARIEAARLVDSNGEASQTMKTAPSATQPEGKPGGYGLRNVGERLRLYFGDRGRLEVDSRFGEGTTVRIVIPACQEPPVRMGMLSGGGERNA